MDGVIAALADPTRRQILEALAMQPHSAGDIARLFAISRPAISRHLRVLRECGLVTDRVAGRQRIYMLQVQPIQEVVAWANRLVTRPGRIPDLDALATEVHRATRDRREREDVEEEIA